MDKVVLGLSGGVDSAVAAHLLRESGLEVYGLYLDNGLPGADAAREAAASLSVPLTIADSREAMEQYVCTPFAEAYLRGETPNPCILCNPAVKFRALLGEAERIGAKYIATGHYARAENGAIYRGQPENDQSYRYFMNYNLFNHVNIDKSRTFVPPSDAGRGERPSAAACAI